jgi:hypothetical protein
MATYIDGVEYPITYKFTNLMKGGLLAELPLNNTTFNLVLNGSGAWNASLNVENKQTRETNWVAATNVWRTAVWIDIEGTLIYGGPVTGRVYDEAKGTVALSGCDFYGYCAHRRQAGNYEAYTDPESHAWATTGAPVATIAYWLLTQAMAVPYSIPIEIVAASQPTPSEFWITFSAPLQQNQTLETMLTQLHNLGYLVGCDIAQEVRYVAGVPTVSIGVFYPRRGRTVAESGLVIEGRLGMQYEEDGTQQSNGVIEQVGGTGATAQESIETFPLQNEEYPLLEQIVSHASVSPTTQSETVLQAYAKGDLAVYTYPLTTPVVNMAMFDKPSIVDLANVGDNARLRIAKQAGEMPNNNPRFPNGLAFDYRTVHIEGIVPDEGKPTMNVTLNIPPSETPITPP